MKSFQLLTVKYDVGCGFVIYVLYYVELLALNTHFVESFYHEWVLNVFKCFFSIYEDDHVVFVLFVNVVDDVDGFLKVVPSLHPWDESHLIVMDNIFYVFLIQFANILLSIFASTFIRDIGL